MTKEEFKTAESKFVVTSAAMAFRGRAAMLRDCAEKLDRRADEIEQFDAKTDRLATRSDLANWTINDIENLIRNLNFADLARVQAALKTVE